MRPDEERAAQPVFLIRRTVARAELQGMLAECFGKLFAHGHKAGLAIAGAPAGEGEIEAAGCLAVGLHGGPCETLCETYEALERWIEANGYRASGPRWESYVAEQ